MSAVGRRRLRRRLLLAGVVPLLLALALAVETALVLRHDAAGRAALASGEPTTAAVEYAANRSSNLLEPWVAPYDEATARFRAGDPLAAVDAFTDALELAPADQVCRVRADLATSHEALGLDLADAERQAARAQWSAGLASLRDCEDPRARAVAARLEALLAGSADASQDPAGDQQPDQPDQQPGQPGGPDGAGGSEGADGRTEATQQQDLAERNERGEDRRQRREARDATRGTGSGSDSGSGSGSGSGAGAGKTGPPAYSW